MTDKYYHLHSSVTPRCNKKLFLGFATNVVIGQFYVSHVKIVMTLSVTLHFAIMVIFSSVMSQDQRRSDKQLASCHVSSLPMRSLYIPSCFLQNLGRKICIRRKINREKTLILKFSCKISSVVVLLLKIW